METTIGRDTVSSGTLGLPLSLPTRRSETDRVWQKRKNRPDNSGRNALRYHSGHPALNIHCSLDRPTLAEKATAMADDQKPDEQIDPVTRVAMMVEAGEVKKITTKILEEALEYTRMKEREQEAIDGNDESES